MPADPSAIAAAVDQVRLRIASAAGRAGRRPEEIRLVAVTKIFGADAVAAAYEAGVRHFGENRVQEWATKHPYVADLAGAVWHLIGHLQRNKARRALALFHRIDSLDTPGLAEKLDELAAEAGRPPRRVPVLIEVRLAPEQTKSGVDPEGLEKLAEAVAQLPRLELRGLMAVPPFSEDPEPSRPYFRRLRELRDHTAKRLGRPLPELSMGMSHDFEVAIEEGATEVRVGTAIFGRRPKLPVTQPEKNAS
ncbi:MAG TPA: YggS family pyridoxal phosphate-dependent enzyme [Candidatus Acidoferrales bacterium]|nr:YggS family pyridoxal phosphate-dependent enzyme [Candidatus Acidoferrales bacterium]